MIWVVKVFSTSKTSIEENSMEFILFCVQTNFMDATRKSMLGERDMTGRMIQ